MNSRPHSSIMLATLAVLLVCAMQGAQATYPHKPVCDDCGTGIVAVKMVSQGYAVPFKLQLIDLSNSAVLCTINRITPPNLWYDKVKISFPFTVKSGDNLPNSNWLVNDDGDCDKVTVSCGKKYRVISTRLGGTAFTATTSPDCETDACPKKSPPPPPPVRSPPPPPCYDPFRPVCSSATADSLTISLIGQGSWAPFKIQLFEGGDDICTIPWIQPLDRSNNNADVTFPFNIPAGSKVPGTNWLVMIGGCNNVKLTCGSSYKVKVISLSWPNYFTVTKTTCGTLACPRPPPPPPPPSPPPPSPPPPPVAVFKPPSVQCTYPDPAYQRFTPDQITVTLASNGGNQPIKVLVIATYAGSYTVCQIPKITFPVDQAPTSSVTISFPFNVPDNSYIPGSNWFVETTGCRAADISPSGAFNCNGYYHVRATDLSNDDNYLYTQPDCFITLCPSPPPPVSRRMLS